MEDSQDSFDSLKSKGNDYFKAQEYNKAIEFYSKALSLPNIHNEGKCILLCNKAACLLKLKEWKMCIEDCTEALNLHPNFEKALYRRSEALYATKEYNAAFRDIHLLLRMNPKNKAAKELAGKLRDLIQEDSHGVGRALEEINDREFSIDHRKTLLHMLSQKCKEKNLCREVVERNGIPILWNFLKYGNDSIHVLAVLASCGDSSIVKSVYEQGSLLSLMVDFVKDPSEETADIDAAKSSIVISSYLLSYLYGLDVPESSSETESVKSLLLDSLVQGLSYPSNQVKDAAIESLIRICVSKEIALNITDSGALREVYNIDLWKDNGKSFYSRLCMLFSQVFSKYEDDNLVKDQLKAMCLSSLKDKGTRTHEKTKSVAILSSLFMVNRDVGLWAVNESNCMNHIEELLKSYDADSKISREVVQEAVLDLVVQIASIESSHSLITPEFFKEIVQLMNSESLVVRAGALAAYVKIAAISKTFKMETPEGRMLLDAVMEILETFEKDESRECEVTQRGNASLNHNNRLITSPKERAVEALSYIISDTDVKEEVVRRPLVLKCLNNLKSEERSSVTYGVCYILSHLMASEGQLKKAKVAEMDISPEQYEELQKALKQQSAFEDGDHAQKVAFRIRKVVEAGGISTLSSMARSSSKAIKEVIAESLLHASSNVEIRGKMIQQGAITALVPLSLDSSESVSDWRHKQNEVMKSASHAIAKILVTTNPSLLPSSQLLSTVHPLLQLLEAEQDLQHFEALMALTNIASTGEDAKRRILAEKGLNRIQYLQFSNHELVRRAATEAICNLLPAPEVVHIFDQQDKLKLWIAFARQEDDFETARAALGALAMVASIDFPKHAQDIWDTDGAFDCFKLILMQPNSEMQHRSAYLFTLMAGLDKAKKVLIDDLEIKDRLIALNSDSNEPVLSVVKELHSLLV